MTGKRNLLLSHWAKPMRELEWDEEMPIRDIVSQYKPTRRAQAPSKAPL